MLTEKDENKYSGIGGGRQIRKRKRSRMYSQRGGGNQKAR